MKEVFADLAGRMPGNPVLSIATRSSPVITKKKKINALHTSYEDPDPDLSLVDPDLYNKSRIQISMNRYQSGSRSMTKTNPQDDQNENYDNEDEEKEKVNDDNKYKDKGVDNDDNKQY